MTITATGDLIVYPGDGDLPLLDLRLADVDGGTEALLSTGRTLLFSPGIATPIETTAETLAEVGGARIHCRSRQCAQAALGGGFGGRRVTPLVGVCIGIQMDPPRFLVASYPLTHSGARSARTSRARRLGVDLRWQACPATLRCPECGSEGTVDGGASQST